MILDDICNSRVYDANAFYVLGLPVDSTSRKIRRRQEDVIEGCAAMGDKAWRNEFDKYLLGDSVPPKSDAARKLFERLKDPEYYASAMFFWFWPQQDNPDIAIDAIAKGDRAKAVRAWRSDMNMSGERGIIARHNLAVALHFYAIDGEIVIRSHKNAIPQEYIRSVDQYWKSAFEFWEGLSDDDLFWDVFAGRVKLINDPRLDHKFVKAFRERFPICFDNINADFMVAYAQSGHLNDAKRHFDYMLSTMSGVDDVQETMERAFKPMVDKVRVLVKQCEAVNEPKKVLSSCRELLNGSKNIVSIFKTLVPSGNAYTKGVLNEVVTTIDSRLPVYSRETNDFEPCLQVTKELLPIAATPIIIERIKKSIEEWERLVRQERERCTCCVCGRYKKGLETIPVHFYKDVHADPLMYGRVEWRTRTINVPACYSCQMNFTNEHARKFAPVKVSLSEGWRFGEKPTDVEMDLALSLRKIL